LFIAVMNKDEYAVMNTPKDEQGFRARVRVDFCEIV
jgi:hypothetical protein